MRSVLIDQAAPISPTIIVMSGAHPLSPTPRVVAIVPVGALDEAKSRLGAVLDPEERLDLTLQLARQTISAAVATPGVIETLVVTPDDRVRSLALELGARPILQRDSGLNRGLGSARDEAIAAGAEAILILPIDLPGVTTEAIRDLLAPLTVADGPTVVIVPDRHGRGTNALVVAPPDAIGFCFGGDSRRAHANSARDAGARLVELGGPLGLDVDTPDDLLLAEPLLRPAPGRAVAPESVASGEAEPVDVG